MSSRRRTARIAQIPFSRQEPHTFDPVAYSYIYNGVVITLLLNFYSITIISLTVHIVTIIINIAF